MRSENCGELIARVAEGCLGGGAVMGGSAQGTARAQRDKSENEAIANQETRETGRKKQGEWWEWWASRMEAMADTLVKVGMSGLPWIVAVSSGGWNYCMRGSLYGQRVWVREREDWQRLRRGRALLTLRGCMPEAALAQCCFAACVVRACTVMP
jgi:hypothetical protein